MWAAAALDRMDERQHGISVCRQTVGRKSTLAKREGRNGGADASWRGEAGRRLYLSPRQIRTSKSRGETIDQREKSVGEPNAKAGLPATDPRGDDGEKMWRPKQREIY